MGSVLSDQLIVERFKKHLEPDEPELYYVFGQQVPSSGLQLLILFLFGWILAALNTAYATKNFFIGLTNKRLLLMKVSMTYEEKDLKSIELSDIEDTRVEDSAMEKIIHLALRSGERYRSKTRKKLYVVEKQEENLKKICHFLQDFTLPV